MRYHIPQEDLIRIADETIPLWRVPSRKLENVFSRTLLAKDLRTLGLSLTTIAEIFGTSHPSVLHWLQKDISRRFLSATEKVLIDAYKKRKLDFLENFYSKELPLLELDGNNECIFYAEGVEIRLQYVAEEIGLRVVKADLNGESIIHKIRQK